MRVTYLTGQAPASVDLGPVIVPGGGGTSSLPVGVEGQLVGYGPNGVPEAVDAPDGSTYDDTAIVARVAAVESAIVDIPAPYDDTALSGRLDSVEADLAAVPAAYDDTALAGRVTDVEADVVAAQSRADAAYSLAEQGGGTGSYDDTELRGRIVTLENEPAPTWTEVTGKPETFPPSSHGHAIADVSGLQAELDAIPPAYDDTALSGRVTALEEAPAPSWDDVTGKPTAFTPAIHGHSIGDISGLAAALDGKASTSHSHAWSEITDKPTTFNPAAHTHAWDEITSKPTTFAPSAHGHSVADVSGLQTALDGKQPTTTFKTVNGEAVTGTGDIAIPSGTNVTITTVNTQAAYDAATPTATQLIVRIA